MTQDLQRNACAWNNGSPTPGKQFGDPIDFDAVNARRSQPGDAQTAYD